METSRQKNHVIDFVIEKEEYIMRKNQIFWGVTFILAGIFLVIGKLGMLGEIGWLSILFTIFCISILIKSIWPLNFSGILFPIAFIGIIYKEQLGIEALTPWTLLLVAALLSIGLSMVFQNHKRYTDYKKYDFELVDEEDESHVKQHTKFGATTKYINSASFKQADLECNFGSLAVYFDKATIPTGLATVRINAKCAGIELYIPKSWNVENCIEVSLGAVEEKNHNEPDGVNTLRLIGSTNLTGTTITYV